MTDDQIDALDTFALHVMAPRGRESVREFATVAWNAAIEAAARVVCPIPHVDEERECQAVAAQIRALKRGS